MAEITENHVKFAVMISSGNDSDDYDLAERILRTDTLQSQDVNEVYNFLQRNCTTAGLSFQYGVSSNTSTNGVKLVYEFVRKGKVGKKDIKAIMEKYQIIEWHYSWAWASSSWWDNDAKITQKAIEIDLSPVETLKTAVQYRHLFGY